MKQCPVDVVKFFHAPYGKSKAQATVQKFLSIFKKM